MAIRVGSTDIANVYVGTTPASKVYLGTQQVWPVKKTYAENFDSYGDYDWGWGPDFLMANANRAVIRQGRAGVDPQNLSSSPHGNYRYADLGTDSHFCDISLGDRIGGTFTASHQNFCIYMRRSNTVSGPHIAFRIAPDGNAEIVTFPDGTVRASRSNSGIGVGEIVRFAARSSGHHAIYNLTEDPNMATPLVQWNDSGRVLLYGADNRAMGMQQFSVYELFTLYSTYTANVLWYGDL